MQNLSYIQEAKDFFKVLKKHRLTESQLFILADSKTSEHCLPLIQDALPGSGRKTILLNLSEGEEQKSLHTAADLYARLIEHRADRHSVLLNLGGGVITDIGGFVASTYKRGMRFINIPTTVLGQVDAAIGGKTGVNFMGYKNMVGTYDLALDTIVFTDFLNTLPKREVMSGFAEVLKHAIIASPLMWEHIKESTYIDLPFIKSLIPEAAQIKLDIVSRDPLEKGERKKLNFGHTIGHALESLALESPDKNLLHGEAVALGMVAETHVAYRKGLISEQVLKEISDVIARSYRQMQVDENQFHRLIEIMRQDKKKEGQKLNMTLISDIGQAVIDQNPTMEMIVDALTYLQRYPFKK